MTQKDKVRAVLESGKAITPLEALTKFGAFRLSAIIFNLKEDGLKIKTNMIDGVNNRYAEYVLDTDSHEISQESLLYN